MDRGLDAGAPFLAAAARHAARGDGDFWVGVAPAAAVARWSGRGVAFLAAHEEGADGGEAGDDAAEATFDDCPDGGVDVVICEEVERA